MSTRRWEAFFMLVINRFLLTSRGLSMSLSIIMDAVCRETM